MNDDKHTPWPAVGTAMTKNELKKSHDAMARFLLRLCKFSDEVWKGNREDIVETHYQSARRLLKRAGIKYAPRI